jgi:polyadenylate-binding protein
MQMLINAPQAQAKQILGERLYALIQPEQGPLAGKITGMLLEGLDYSEVVALIDDHNALRNKIREALAALEANAQAAQRCSDRGQVSKSSFLEADSSTQLIRSYAHARFSHMLLSGRV